MNAFRRWYRRVVELRAAIRILPEFIAAHETHAGASIRDAIDAIERDARRIARQEVRSALNGLATRLDPVGEEFEGSPDRVQVSCDIPTLVTDLSAETLPLASVPADSGDLVSKAHESSFHVADSEVAPSGDPATIMAGTPDTDPSHGDGASVEGPAPRSGPSISSKVTREELDYLIDGVVLALAPLLRGRGLS